MRGATKCALGWRLAVVEVKHQWLFRLRSGGSILPALYGLDRALDKDGISAANRNVRDSSVWKYDHGQPNQPLNMQALQSLGIGWLDLRNHFAGARLGLLGQQHRSENGGQAKHQCESG